MGITPSIIVPYSKAPDPELKGQAQHPMEKDLERHLEGVEESREEKEPKEGDKKVFDSQLERALQILKSWEIFQRLSLKK
jgi:hypothetical protein